MVEEVLVESSRAMHGGEPWSAYFTKTAKFPNGSEDKK